MKRFVSAALVLACVASPSVAASRLVEPRLTLSGHAEPGQLRRVALTFDACSGQTDGRILSVLIDNNIPATIFVTGRWLRRNAGTMAVLASRPDLFEIENHGAQHIPAIDEPVKVYGIAAAGNTAAIEREVGGGDEALRASGISSAHWFRGATAKYTLSSIATIRRMGFQVAGYSVNGDGGSLLGAAESERHIASAKDGDVIIAHINQPSHSAGAGVVKGILDLKAKGYRFVKLNDATEDGTNQTTN